MAQTNFSNVTLSLTLPISCHICLGKVRKPVICVNHHVFCSSCIEMWLKTASRCPACRAPITDESPCREIIGGTNESEPSVSSNVKRRLRKTRGELILKEYEDEIEELLKENEELKTTNQQLESQLKTALETCTVSAPESDDKKLKYEDLSNKLRVVYANYKEMKEEMKRLKEANKTFRSQNIDLVQESMRLKAEVASRSPQKFGRYTVAALEAKVHQYERDMDHLRRALERSDQYIEDLHCQATDDSKKRRPSDLRETSRLDPTAQSESGVEGVTETGAACAEKQSIATMRRSLSNMETASICTSLDDESQTLPCNGGSFLFATSLGLAVPEQRPFVEALGSQPGQKEDTTSSTSDSVLPFTPAFAFRSLSLKSPAGLRSDKKLVSKPVTYLRRLSFESCAGPSNTEGEKYSGLDSLLEVGSRFKPGCWGAWKTPESTPLTDASPKQARNAGHAGRNAAERVSRLQGGADASMSSEASMDAAYQDKISELDSMMLEGESSSSQGSQLSLASLSSANSADFDTTLVPELNPNDDDVSVEADRWPTGEGSAEVVERPPSSSSEQAGESITSRVKATSAAWEGGGGSPSPGCLGEEGAGGSSQADELSFDLLFGENRERPSGSHAPAGHASCGTPRKPGDTARDKHTMTPSKRKSHSPSNITSTSKHSKYT